MFRVSEQIAIREGCGAIVTGDAIGQKASQTLQNIVSADSVLKTSASAQTVGGDEQTAD